MPTIELTDHTFEQTVTDNEIVLVDFWADWCPPCRAFSPVFEASSDKYPGVVHGKLDTEASPGVPAAARITSIPTLMGFRDGVLVYRIAGALSASALKDVVEGIKGLDMDEIRAKIAQEESAGAGSEG